MKTEIFDRQGNVTTGQNDSKATYVEYDKVTVRIHLSETDKISKGQVQAIGALLATVGKGKLLTQVPQHSKNTIGFTLAKENDTTKSQTSIQDAYDAVVAEAKRVNAQQSSNNGQGNQGQQNGNQSGNNGQQNGGQGQQQNGNQSGNSGQGNQSSNQNGGQQQSQGNQGQQQNGNQNGNQSGNSGQGNQGQQNGSNAQQSNNNAQQPDKTKDIFGRPLKQSYPGLFWSGMSPQEEQAAFDSYWDMVHHVDKDIFHKK